MRFLVGALLILGCGCTSIELQKTTPREQYQRTRHNVLDGGDASEFTCNILRRRGLFEGHRSDPVGTIEKLEAELRQSRDRSITIAIAELAMLQTERVNNVDERALATAVRYSYAYLFDPQLVPAPDPFDARFRDACDVYNFALAALLRIHPEETRHKKKTWTLEWYAGSTKVRMGADEFSASRDDFEKLRIATDYVVAGLAPPDLRHGLGVPCLLDRPTHQGTSEAAQKAKANSYLPATTSNGATVLMRWPSEASILDEKHATGTIELFDPMETTEVSIGDRRVPLEVDYTTAIAELVEQQPDDGGLSALLHVDDYQKRIGLYMFQPFNPNRVTVVFVHGLASGPETWLPLYNQLLADPTIRTRFQFVFWFYPTGQPALTSARQLREALRDAHHAYGGDAPLSNGPGVIVCGHSLGGILTSALIVDSGDLLWDTLFTAPPQELPVDEKRRELLESTLKFEALPFITRVVYFSAPHRGAPEANTGFMQWASGLIELPRDLLTEDAALRKYVQKDARFQHHTVAQSLMAHNAMMEHLSDLQATTKVPFHSIIGDKDQAGKVGGTDGFVPYWSSHLDGAESELIILSGHSTEHKPEAARETRRILLEHLKQVDAR